MKNYQIYIFYTIVIIIYSLINYFIFNKGLQAISFDKQLRNVYVIVFSFFFISFIAGRILEKVWLSPISIFFTWVGSFWLAAMLFFFLISLLISAVGLFNYFFHFYEYFEPSQMQKIRLVVFTLSVVITFILVFAGFINARIIAVKNISLTIENKSVEFEDMKIAMASDIHLGSIINKRFLSRAIQKINDQNPDLILFAGDIVDEDIQPVLRFDLGNQLSQLQSTYGVYAITGNHEYIGDAEKAISYLSNYGINFVRDTAVLVHNKFYVAGREDRDKVRFTGINRKDLSEIFKQVDFRKLVIFMDHQPFNLEETASFPVDISLSGHTHHGQIWPLNYITKAIFEISKGFKKIKNTHFYVSSGLVTWGPPVRLTARPEIVIFHLTFE